MSRSRREVSRLCVLAVVAAALLAASCNDPKHGTVARGRVVVAEPADVAGPEDVVEDTLPATPALVECGRETVRVRGLDDVAALLVMDRSSSMATRDKWRLTQEAVGVALAAYDRHIRFGLLMFPQAADQCALEPEPDVQIDFETGPEIVQRMASSSTLRGTPTGSALEAARDILLDQVPDADHRVVILATDGGPSCPARCWMCTSPTTGGCADGACGACDDKYDCAVAEALNAVDDLADEGIPTYVIGIFRTDTAEGVLNEMATRGGTALGGASGGNLFYETTNGGDIARAMISIALGVDGCSAKLTPRDEAYDQIVVSVGDRALPRDAAHAQGYDLEEEGAGVRLFGAACLDAVDDEGGEVTVRYLCAPDADAGG
ncbi:MAG: VWA domain-containing protein [Deltaproteobacteria bacterium]|nr:VWA domain-containing protein [Deltaproteobacteria bacterium]